jgi:hypothetical protein
MSSSRNTRETCGASKYRPGEAAAVDHKARAIHFHRRAQAAEGALELKTAEARIFLSALRASASRALHLAQEQYAAASALRAALRREAFRDPLTRIIALGEEFP